MKIINVTCPNCDKTGLFEGSYSDTDVRCPFCNHIISQRKFNEIIGIKLESQINKEIIKLPTMTKGDLIINVDRTCTNCFGKGECRSCAGRGHVPTDILDPFYVIFPSCICNPCPACRGTGKCYTCKGKGVI